MKVALDHRIVLNTNVHVRPEIFGGVVYNPTTKEIFKVPKLGFLILKLCNGNYTMHEMIDGLSRRLQVSQQSFQMDMLSFIDELLDRDIVTLKNAEPKSGS